MTLSSYCDRVKQTLEQRLLFGNRLTPELVAILLVYLVQGSLGLARLGVSFFLKDDLGLTPAEVAALTGITMIPWTIKPLFGFVSDALPIARYRRRPYLILAGVLGALAWVALATVVNTPWAATAAIFVTSLTVAVSDVVVDSIVVERARVESQAQLGSIQSLCWSTMALGSLVTAYFSGFLLEQVSVRTVFGLVAALPLLIAIAAILIDESPTATTMNWQGVWGQVKQLKQAVTQKSVWLPTGFIFLWMATPSAESAMFFFTTNELGFQPEFLGRVRLVASIAAILGIWIFQRFLKAVPFRVIFAWGTVLSTGLGLTTLLLVTHANRAIGIDDYWFSLGDTLVLTVVGEIAFMPVLVLAARICPPGVEATLFALLMSVLNLGGVLSAETGALIMQGLGITENQFEHLWILVLITNLSTLLPLPLLFWLPDTTASDAAPIAAASPTPAPAAPSDQPTASAQPDVADVSTPIVSPSPDPVEMR